jgi:hypothetical protein
MARADDEAFFALAQDIDIRMVPFAFPLQEANAALSALRSEEFDGVAVLIPAAAMK